MSRIAGGVMTCATNRNLAGPLTKPARLPFVVTSAVRAVTTRSRAFSADRRVKGWLLPCTALLPALLTVGWLVADARQSGDYSPVRQTVSVLAGHEATDRWIVTGALYLVGVGYLVAAWGLAAVGPPAQLGLAVAGAAAFGVATFPVAADGTSRPARGLRRDRCRDHHPVARPGRSSGLACPERGGAARLHHGDGGVRRSVCLDCARDPWRQARSGRTDELLIAGLLAVRHRRGAAPWRSRSGLRLRHAVTATQHEDDHERPRVRHRRVDAFGHSQCSAAVRGREHPGEQPEEHSRHQNRPANGQDRRGGPGP
ncbi:MAG: hypothetical protein DLM58_05675 [Pseudonocardiales bacterium]|nr:MAG: hypothetical protein DLM58_05675 [Pseudonocardiales bacterium]